MGMTDQIEAEIAAIPQVVTRTVGGYGEDIGGLQSLDWSTTTAGTLLKQQQYRAITTAPGSNFGLPGGLDIQTFIHSSLSDAEMSGRVVAELRQDPRVESVQCVVVRSASRIRLDIVSIPADLQAASVPLTLTAYVTQSGVQLG